ncbi:MAG: hypothetical protein MK102_15745 [Fuerstiella sp.]|nr:hypothetical protein [Fuerstiella sp.]
MFSSFKPLRFLTVIGIALLQVAMAPLTHVVHVGCHYHAHSPVATAHSSSFHHAHGHHAHGHHSHGDSESDNVPDHSHDSDNCAVCQAAFAAQIADCPASRQPAADLTILTPVSPQQMTRGEFRYAMPVRGPPAA